MRAGRLVTLVCALVGALGIAEGASTAEKMAKAIQAGKIKKLGKLVEKKATEADLSESFALAVSLDRQDAVEVLLSAKPFDWGPAVQRALEEDSPSRVKWLEDRAIQGCGSSSLKSCTSTFQHAVRNGRANTVRRFLDAGIYPYGLEDASRSGNAEIVAMLLDRGAAPNRVQEGRILQVSGGPDSFVIAKVKRVRSTPLGEAIRAGSPEIVRLLLEEGADPGQEFIKGKDYDGVFVRFGLEIVDSQGSSVILPSGTAAMSSWEITLRGGGKVFPHLRGSQSNPFSADYAEYRGLADHYEDALALAEDQLQSPLTLAVDMGETFGEEFSRGVAELLLDFGAKADWKDMKGRTAREHAVSRDLIKVAMLLEVREQRLHCGREFAQAMEDGDKETISAMLPSIEKCDLTVALESAVSHKVLKAVKASLRRHAPARYDHVARAIEGGDVAMAGVLLEAIPPDRPIEARAARRAMALAINRRAPELARALGERGFTPSAELFCEALRSEPLEVIKEYLVFGVRLKNLWCRTVSNILEREGPDTERILSLVGASLPQRAWTSPLFTEIGMAWGNFPEREKEALSRIRLMAEHGADLSAVRAGGVITHFVSTPLHYAVERHGSGDVLRLLLDLGADPVVQDLDGRTPLDLAREIQEAGEYDRSEAIRILTTAVGGLVSDVQ